MVRKLFVTRVAQARQLGGGWAKGRTRRDLRGGREGRKYHIHTHTHAPTHTNANEKKRKQAGRQAGRRMSARRFPRAATPSPLDAMPTGANRGPSRRVRPDLSSRSLVRRGGAFQPRNQRMPIQNRLKWFPLAYRYIPTYLGAVYAPKSLTEFRRVPACSSSTEKGSSSALSAAGFGPVLPVWLDCARPGTNTRHHG